MEHYFSDSTSAAQRRASFAILTEKMMNSLIEIEENPDQQSANCAMSGRGRTHFLPLNRKESTSHYFLHDHEMVISACKSAIKIHQSIYKVDPKTILISYKMYFSASEEMSDLGTSWNGTLQFTGIAGDEMNTSMMVHNHANSDMVICTH